MFITKELLIEKEACVEGLEAFKAAYPEGLVLETKDQLVEALRKGLGRWLVWFRKYFDISHLKTSQGRLDLQGANLQRANLQGVDLRWADLRGAYLQRAYLQGANLQGAYLQWANLQGADLRGADLRGADLQEADLQGALGV